MRKEQVRKIESIRSMSLSEMITLALDDVKWMVRQNKLASINMDEWGFQHNAKQCVACLGGAALIGLTKHEGYITGGDLEDLINDITSDEDHPKDIRVILHMYGMLLNHVRCADTIAVVAFHNTLTKSLHNGNKFRSNDIYINLREYWIKERNKHGLQNGIYGTISFDPLVEYVEAFIRACKQCEQENNLI